MKKLVNIQLIAFRELFICVTISDLKDYNLYETAYEHLKKSLKSPPSEAEAAILPQNAELEEPVSLGA